MEAKKTVKIIFIVIVAAIVIFGLILFFNNHLENKVAVSESAAEISESVGDQQSYIAAVKPVVSDDDFVSGANGDLTVIVYEDYGDAFSANFAASLEKARLDFSKRLKFVYRPFNVAHTDLSAAAALALACAVDQGKGELLRDKIFQAVRANQLNLEKLKDLAALSELNGENFQSCLTNSEKKEKIDKLSVEAVNFSVYGAPTVFVGDEMIVGARPYDTFIDSNGDEIEGLKQVIERQLK